MSTSPRRVSRAALNRLEEQEDMVTDPRAQQLRSIAVTQDPAVLNALEAIFEGTGVMADEHKAQMLVQIRHEVHAEWRKAKQSFLAIGKSLLAVDKLSPRTSSDASARELSGYFRSPRRSRPNYARSPVQSCPGDSTKQKCREAIPSPIRSRSWTAPRSRSRDPAT
jgi:hypothetical protein